MRFLITLTCLLWLPLGALAQDEEKGGLEGLLEKSLSSDTLQVTVDGLAELAFTIGQDNGTIEVGASSTYSGQVTNVGLPTEKKHKSILPLLTIKQ